MRHEGNVCGTRQSVNKIPSPRCGFHLNVVNSSPDNQTQVQKNSGLVIRLVNSTIVFQTLLGAIPITFVLLGGLTAS